jgi:hypothetical protein
MARWLALTEFDRLIQNAVSRYPGAKEPLFLLKESVFKGVWNIWVSGRQKIDRVLENMPADEKTQTLLAASSIVRSLKKVPTALKNDRSTSWDELQDYLSTLASTLLRQPIEPTEEDLLMLLGVWSEPPPKYVDPVDALLDLCTNHFSREGPSDQLRDALEKLKAGLGRDRDGPHRLTVKCEDLLDPARRNRIVPVDAWTIAVSDALEAVDEPALKKAFSALSRHCDAAKGSKPSKAWSKKAGLLLAELATASEDRPEAVGEIYRTGLDAVGAKAPFMVETESGGFAPEIVADRHSNTLRGWIWLASVAPELASSSKIGDVAMLAFKKVPGHGQLSAKHGNACLYVLGESASMGAVGELTRLKARIKYPSTLRQIERTLHKVAERLGLEPADLEEIAAPTCGLSEVGLVEETIGEFTASVRVGIGGTVTTEWRRGTKPQKSIPIAVKEQHATELKQIRATAKELKKLLPGQKVRVERLLLSRRSWSLGDWAQRYLNHPLLGTFARRLIWRFRERSSAEPGAHVDAAWLAGSLRTVDGQLFEPEADSELVLWHPIESSVSEVKAWRAWLQDNEVVQPFKQAHREIYLVTDAERETHTYSNRFAGHVLKQHQFAALCKERGWGFTLMGEWDSHNTPTITIPEGYKVEYRVQANPSIEVSEASVYLCIETDQVRFFTSGEYEPLPLDQVPPLIFSELMRDVDLFVGVCSVGNDPNWHDGGAQGYPGYWSRYAFGELGQSAEIRREILAGLLPKLAIAVQCHIDGRFLVVRGKLREYSIHLGSGNVQMSPNSEYLCIVPAAFKRSRTPELILPFEGDQTLAVILSKAFMLAKDDRIKDPGILSQMRVA